MTHLQMLLVHGTPLQQSLFCVHVWPSSAQVPPSCGGGPLSVPASGVGGLPQ